MSVNIKQSILDKVLKQRSLKALMDIYERNYRLIMHLMPEAGQYPGELVSRCDEGPDLYIRIEEQSRYTTTLFMTHYLDIDGEHIADPGIQVRVYHDARQAEVMSCRLQGFMAMDKTRKESSTILDCKSESNIFLLKWLEYLIASGHCGDSLQDSDAGALETA